METGRCEAKQIRYPGADQGLCHSLFCVGSVLQGASAAVWAAGKGVSKLSKKQAGQIYTTALAALLKVNLHLEV